MLERLVRARKDAQISQTELARRLGRGQPMISLYEAGERRIDPIEFYAIATALGYDPVQLYTEIVAELPDKVEI